MSAVKTGQHPLHWLPNALTIGRIIFIPVLVWAILNKDIYSIALPLAITIFIGSMLTDFLDGYFARKWQVTSDFGRMLDPIADKLLVAAGLIALCLVQDGHWLFVIPSLVIIGRDISVSGIREHAANAQIILAPTKLAKWKTACEMLSILVILLAYSLTSSGLRAAIAHGGIAILWLAAILSAYTGFHYFRSAMRPH